MVAYGVPSVALEGNSANKRSPRGDISNWSDWERVRLRCDREASWVAYRYELLPVQLGRQ